MTKYEDDIYVCGDPPVLDDMIIGFMAGVFLAVVVTFFATRESIFHSAQKAEVAEYTTEGWEWVEQGEGNQ